MPLQQKRWRYKEIPEKDAKELCNQLRIDSTICSILASRGIKTFDHAKTFFRPQLEGLHDPWLMKDMRIAVDRILQAIKQNEKILIYGDYDVDGTTSVAVLYDFLSFISPTSFIEYYIPDRYKEGYGLSAAGIDYAASHQFSLLITLDCGIKSVDLIQKAKEKNIDTIVCDHHLPGNSLPPAVAILNAKQPLCNYPFKELCGCGVGFKLIQALCIELGLSNDLYVNYLDLVATAIAADIVPITGENRILAFHGLKKANENPNTGINALLEQSKIQSSLSINGLSFVIGPRINAAGRMGDAKRAVSLFIEKDFNQAKIIASTLQVENTNRKEADSSITEEALEQINLEINFQHKKTIVVHNEHWHKGVLGIVASRLLEKYYRPTIVLTKSGEFYTGSARSIAGFNIYDALDRCSEFLHAFGGHYFAAGMTIAPQHLSSFIDKFESVANDVLTENDMIPEIEIDAAIQLSNLNQSFYNILQQMEPFGPDNTKPIFCVKNAQNIGCRVVKEEHVRFEIAQDGHIMNGIGFNLAKKYEALNRPNHLDVVFVLDENHFNGKTTLQMKVLDFRVSEK
jgi:single-stranded-DNA-specific exonuclease